MFVVNLLIAIAYVTDHNFYELNCINTSVNNK